VGGGRGDGESPDCRSRDPCGPPRHRPTLFATERACQPRRSGLALA
jgi:hypothetical protein